MNNTTETFISNAEHNSSISKYAYDGTTIMPQHEIYVNSIFNIHDIPSLVEFYNLMFSGNPFLLLSCVIIGAYIGCMFIEVYRKKSKRGEKE